MSFRTWKVNAALAVVSAALGTSMAQAVYVDPDDVGQALIYPYFSAQERAGNPFNTYLSVVNQSAVAKVMRVRFREGRRGKEVAGFNLYLAPRDTWTGERGSDAIGTSQ